MRISLFTPNVSPVATPAYLRALARGAEERGFHAIWVPEHVVLFDDYASRYPYSPDGRIPAAGESGMLDPLASLPFLASLTERIRLGTGICLLPQRNPVYAAKEAATVDWLSGGRLDFGIGVGWLAEEFSALGVPFARRGARCRDYVGVLRTLWCDAISQHKGEFYELPPCRQYPKPVQKPHPPLHFGGESEAALRRVADLGQGWYGFNLEPAEARERIARLEQLLAERGRRRGEIEVSVSPYLRPADFDLVQRYREAGVDQLILLLTAPDPQRLRPALDALAEEIVEPARRLA